MSKVVMVLLLTVFTSAQNTTRNYVAYDRETITVSNTKAVFTAGKVQSTTNPTNRADLVTFTVNCASGTTCVLRMNVDGTDPTTTVGERALYGDLVRIYGFDNINHWEGIRETSTSVVIDVTYYRQ